MLFAKRLTATAALLLTGALPGAAQQWTEATILRTFIDQNPYIRDARARVAVAEAESRGRTLYPNPSFFWIREGAGFTEFFQAEQAIPINGRLQLLRQAGASSARAVEAGGAFDLWQARTSLRLAFYRLLAAQERQALYVNNTAEIDRVVRVLRTREEEGEGSRFDRLRTERERAELMAEFALVKAESELERARLLAFLPPGTPVTEVSGRMETSTLPMDAGMLTQRALNAREDYRVELRRLDQFRLEQRAAERLRIPDPVVSAGLKRADLGRSALAHGPVVQITVPLPVFNRGQADAERFSAEQERVSARMRILAQRIRAEIEGTVRAFNVRFEARDRYLRELGSSGPELIRIATVAYDDGEIGILQLLDVYRTQRQAQSRVIDILLAVREAQIDLERAIGEELGL